MDNEIMSPEDLEANVEIGDAPQAPDLESDTPAETTPEETSTPAGDETPQGEASGETAPVKPAEEAIPRWRLNQEIERRKNAEALLHRMAPNNQPPAEASKPKPEEAAPVAPNPKDFTDYDQYLDAREKFIEDKAERKAKQTTEQEWNRRIQDQQAQAQTKSFEDRITKAQRNWETSTREATAKDPNLQTHIDAAMNIPKLAGLMVMESEHAADLAAVIGRTEGLVEKLWSQAPDQQMRTLATLEATIAHGKKPGNGGPVKKPSASVPALNPARLGNTQNSTDIFKGDVSQDAFTRGLFPLPR